MGGNAFISYPGFDSLFRKKRNSLEQIAYYMIGNREEAKDIVNRCFMNLWEHKDSIREDNALSYMFVAIRNACIDYRRKDTAHKKVYEDLKKSERSAMEYYTSTIESQDPSALLGSEIISIVRTTMAALPEEHRKSYILARVKGLTYKETAETLGITAKRVDKILQGVTKRLRAALKEYLPSSLVALYLSCPEIFSGL